MILCVCMAGTVLASGDPVVGIGIIITASAATAANGVARVADLIFASGSVGHFTATIDAGCGKRGVGA